MNVFSKITLQSLKKNYTRTIVTVIGVILSVALITAVTTFISSMQDFLVRSSIADTGDWHGKFMDVDQGFIQDLDKKSEVTDTTLVQNLGYSFLEGGKNKYKPYLFIAGFEDKSFETLPVKLVEGRLPKAKGEILIPSHIKTNGGVIYKVGDTLNIEIGNRVQDGKSLNQNKPFLSDDDEPESFVIRGEESYKIVGIYERPSFEPYSAPGYTVITLASSASVSPNNYDVYYSLKSPSRIFDFEKQFAEVADAQTNSEYLRALGVSENIGYNAVVYSMAAILIMLILVGSVLLIYNSFSISVSERVRQFGILSSVGATKRQLRRSVLFEGICIGAVGIPLGILSGIAGIGITLKLLQGILDSILFRDGVHFLLSVSVPSVVIAGIIGIVVILISAYIPARKAAKRPAIESIRQTQDIKIEAGSVKTPRLTDKLFGLEGRIAHKNFKRNKKRYRSTVISLVVSVVLFVSASAFGMYLKTGTETSFAGEDFDISVYLYRSSDVDVSTIYQKLQSVNGITNSSFQVYTAYSGEIPVSALSDRYKQNFSDLTDLDNKATHTDGVSLTFIDDRTYFEFLKSQGLSAEKYDGKGNMFLAYAKNTYYDPDSRRVISFDILKDKQDVSITLKSFVTDDDRGPFELTLTPTDKAPFGFSTSSFSGFGVLAPYSARDNFISDSDVGIYMVFETTDSIKSEDEMVKVLSEHDIFSENYHINNIFKIEQENRRILLVVNVFAYGFIILMALITIANVFNTISTNINLRRREFAMLRSVGMTGKSFNKMMNLESVLFGVKALLIGLPISGGITYLIYLAMMEGVDVAFSLPWLSIGISVVGVFIVVFISMIYSTNKIKTENMIEAIKRDA